jgi:hypothetical protein
MFIFDAKNLGLFFIFCRPSLVVSRWLLVVSSSWFVIWASVDIISTPKSGAAALRGLCAPSILDGLARLMRKKGSATGRKFM